MANSMGSSRYCFELIHVIAAAKLKLKLAEQRAKIPQPIDGTGIGSHSRARLRGSDRQSMLRGKCLPSRAES